MVMEINTLFLLFFLSFFSGIIDLSLGMGYGFTVTPIMLLLGYSAEVAVPVVLFTSSLGGLVSSFFNHRMKNVNFSLGSRSTQIAAFAGLFGIFGSILGATISFNLPSKILDLYIGSVVVLSGILVVISLKIKTSFSWGKIFVFTLFGSLNKGLTGSGFGPVLTTGNMLSGVDEKSSISIQALSESVISFIGFITYSYLGKSVNYPILFVMSFGVLVASPLSAYIIKRMDGKMMRVFVGLFAIIIGISTFIKFL